MDEVIRPINFDEILKKQKNYKSFNELRDDFSWFAHNLKTKRLTVNKKREIVKKVAESLVDSVTEEIKSLLQCSECYVNAYHKPENSFVVPCKKPHILLWADCDEYGYWPAKMMSYNEDVVHVRFFGDHTNACVPSSSCYIFSNDAPMNRHNPAHHESYNLAMKVGEQIHKQRSLSTNHSE